MFDKIKSLLFFKALILKISILFFGYFLFLSATTFAMLTEEMEDLSDLFRMASTPTESDLKFGEKWRCQIHGFFDSTEQDISFVETDYGQIELLTYNDQTSTGIKWIKNIRFTNSDIYGKVIDIRKKKAHFRIDLSNQIILEITIPKSIESYRPSVSGDKEVAIEYGSCHLIVPENEHNQRSFDDELDDFFNSNFPHFLDHSSHSHPNLTFRLN